MKEKLKAYRHFFGEGAFWNKLARFAKRAGAKTVYAALLLFYAYKRKETPSWAKKIVIGSLGYLIAPIDVLPDLTPFLGFTDDLGILSFGLVTVAAFVNDEVRGKARSQLQRWFKDVDVEDLKAVDEQL